MKRTEEVVAHILALKKIETQLVEWATRLTAEERGQVKDELTARSDQRALDIWWDATEIADERR